MLTDDGPLAIAVPRDRQGTFEPQLIPKHARRFTGFDDKIIALYARSSGWRCATSPPSGVVPRTIGAPP